LPIIKYKKYKPQQILFLIPIEKVLKFPYINKNMENEGTR